MGEYGGPLMVLVNETEHKGLGMFVAELTCYGENIPNCIMQSADHADCHNFVVSIREQRQAEV